MTPNKPQLVLVPGLLNDADLWADQISGLSDIVSCHVADITQGGTLREVAQKVLDRTDPSFAIAGFSLGGYVAQEIARLAPERIERLALLDTSITADTPARTAERRSLDRMVQAPGQFNGFGKRLARTYLDPLNVDNKAMVGRIRAMTQRLGPEIFLRQNAMERKDGAAILRSLSCPILILYGESDALTPLEDHRAMLKLAPHAMFVAVPQSGHMAPIENPHAVTAALRAWLQQDATRAAIGIAAARID